MKIKRKLNAFALVIFQTVMGSLLGLICGILYSFGGLILDILVSLGRINSSETPGLSYGTLLAFGALIGLPIIFALRGLVMGIIEVILYYLFSKWLNRIEINF